MAIPVPVTRQDYRHLRRQLSASEQQSHSRSMSALLNRNKVIRNASRIACYLSNDGEIAPGGIAEAGWERRQSIYLPVLSPLNNSLYFAPWKPDSRFQLNRFGIAEPECSPREWLSARQLDVILLPLVAFDLEGNRLGMGGGFYDRTLAFLRHRKYHRKPALIGLAHEIQRADSLSPSAWDIPLDAIATEQRLLFFRQAVQV